MLWKTVLICIKKKKKKYFHAKKTKKKVKDKFDFKQIYDLIWSPKVFIVQDLYCSK